MRVARTWGTPISSICPSPAQRCRRPSLPPRLPPLPRATFSHPPATMRRGGRAPRPPPLPASALSSPTPLTSSSPAPAALRVSRPLKSPLPRPTPPEGSTNPTGLGARPERAAHRTCCLPPPTQQHRKVTNRGTRPPCVVAPPPSVGRHAGAAAGVTGGRGGCRSPVAVHWGTRRQAVPLTHARPSGVCARCLALADNGAADATGKQRVSPQRAGGDTRPPRRDGADDEAAARWHWYRAPPPSASRITAAIELRGALFCEDHDGVLGAGAQCAGGRRRRRCRCSSVGRCVGGQGGWRRRPVGRRPPPPGSAGGHPVIHRGRVPTGRAAVQRPRRDVSNDPALTCATTPP